MYMALKRSFAFGCAIASLLAVMPVRAQQRTFDIPAQDVRQAVPEFARQAGVQISAPTGDMRDVRTKPIKGNLDARAALQAMIESTGLSIASDDGSMIVLRYEEPAPTPPGPPPTADPVEPVQQPGEAKARGAAAEPTDVDSAVEEIIVTGSQIRGIKPIGANVLSQSREDIKITGATDTNQLLGQLPQSNFFLTLQQPNLAIGGRAAVNTPISRPNLRNIPGATTSSGSPTLVLIDGHRVVGAGLNQSVVDPSIVPPGMIERTEVLLDGVSAVYGSDAVGGVINFITRKRFDGIESNTHYGFADDYWQADTGLTVGKTWDSGGIVLNYEFGKNSDLRVGDRDYLAPLNYVAFNPPQVDDLSCAVPNVQNSAGTTTYHVDGAGLSAGALYCNGSRDNLVSPPLERHTVFGSVTQDIGENVKLDVTAFYSNRGQDIPAGSFQSAVTIAPTNPYYRCDPAVTGSCATGDSAANQRVSFDYGPALGRDNQTGVTTVDVAQITPALTIDVGADWQVRALTAYGESKTSVEQTRLNAAGQTALVRGTTFATALNPYNIADPRQNLGAISDLVRDYHAESKQSFIQTRLAADGPLFSLPGGEVGLAAGIEWMKQEFSRRLTNETTWVIGPYVDGSTSSKSAFAELAVPIIGSENSRPGIHSLMLSFSGRFDDYGQYGDTFNPKASITFQPVDWISLRGSGGKSFRAPNAVDQAASTLSTGTCTQQPGCSSQPNLNPPGYNFTYPNSDFTFVGLGGTVKDLKPETSTNWSIGADVSPPIVPGLTLSATYWEIDFRNFISIPTLTGDFAQLLAEPSLSKICVPPPGQGQTSTCDLDEIATFLEDATNKQAILDTIAAGDYQIAGYFDYRVRNLGGAKVTGADFSANYQRPTGFGSIQSYVNISLPLVNDFNLLPTSPVSDELATGDPKFLMTAAIGATVGDFFSQATVRHRSGFDPDIGLPRLASQTRIPSFTVVDVAFRYAVMGSSEWTEDLDLSLNVNNVLDAHPPYDKTNNGGVTNGATLGRLFQFGVSKRF